MDIDQHAPITASGSVDISASPLEVWAVLTDIGRWPTWNPDVTEARLEGELSLRRHVRLALGAGTMSSVLRSVEVGRELGWTATSRGAHGTWVWRIEPTQLGSRVTVEESWSGWSTRFMHKRIGRVTAGRSWSRACTT